MFLMGKWSDERRLLTVFGAVATLMFEFYVGKNVWEGDVLYDFWTCLGIGVAHAFLFLHEHEQDECDHR